MDRLSASVLESFIHLTGADQVRIPSDFSPGRHKHFGCNEKVIISFLINAVPLFRQTCSTAQVGSISRHWQSGAPLPSATSLTWSARRTSGFLPMLLRARIPGSSVSPATCGRRTCPSIAPPQSTMHGCLPTPAFSYCLHKLTSSEFPPDYQSLYYFSSECVINVLSSPVHPLAAALSMPRR